MKDLLISLRAILVLTLLLGIAYPVFVTWGAQALFPKAANGSIVIQGNTAIGSELIGQSFGDAKLFHGRPSAAGAGYDGLASGGSNLGPTSAPLMDRIRHDCDSLTKLYPELPRVWPSDMLTASGSGLDPDISPANALAQAPVIARTNGIALARIEKLVKDNTTSRDLAFLGEPRVNVLALNIALSALKRQ